MILVNPHWIVDHDGALEDAKGLPCWQTFGSLSDPCLACNVVGEEECGQVGVVTGWYCKDGCSGSDIIDDDDGVLKGIDADCVPCA